MKAIHMQNAGLTNTFIEESQLYPHLRIGRISAQYRHLYKVYTEIGEQTAVVSGKFRHKTNSLADYPAVGDFVMISQNHKNDSREKAYREDGFDEQNRAIIHHVLTRKSSLERRAVGNTNDRQVVAANIDIVFICMALNNDYNLRRLERYLSIAWDSKAIPVVVLTKSDLCDDVQLKLNEVYTVAIGVDVITTSCITEEGYFAVKNYMEFGKTFVFIGSSGVGKSTLINRLIQSNVMNTNEIRSDDKGRHTTTHRELFVLPDGGVIIDTPGLREIGLDHADLSKSFSDIDQLASQCKFSNCSHQSEPMCAVKQAIIEGNLSAERLASYLKLKKEAKYQNLNARQIETEKLNQMFEGIGGMKKARKYIRNRQK